MTDTRRTVRWHRFSLAQALAREVDDTGQTRITEAIQEFDRSLGEPGDDPPGERIHLEVGRLLDATNPSGALRRYILGVDGSSADDAIASARRVLDGPHGRTAAQSLPAESVGRITQIARRRRTVGGYLLAAKLLRNTAQDDEVLDLLQAALQAALEAADRKAHDLVIVPLAEVLLDLDRPSEVLELIAREDPGASIADAQAARARAHLRLGEFTQAMALADRGPDLASIRTVKALSLLGLGRADEGLSMLPESKEPEILLTRTILCLATRDYSSALAASWDLLRSRPDDPDALLARTQATVEALGAPSDAGEADDDSPATTPHDQVDDASRLLDEVADVIHRPTWWWRVQDALRPRDGRYQFFRCEMRCAMGLKVTPEEIDRVDRGDTTWLQDAALEERRARLYEAASDTANFALALDAAAKLYRDQLGDEVRAYALAREAFDLAPTVSRAAEYAYRSFAVSYETGLEREEAARRVNDAIEVTDRWLFDAAGNEFKDLVHMSAWLRARRVELSARDRVKLTSAALPWTLAALAIRAQDAALRSSLAIQLQELGMPAAARACARSARERDPDDSYVLETSVVVASNESGDPGEVTALLDHLATVHAEPEWRNAIEMYMASIAGDLPKALQLSSGPLIEAAWLARARAVTMAMAYGIRESQSTLQEALDAQLADSPPAYPDAVFLACVLGRADDADKYLAAAEESGNVVTQDLDRIRLTLRFAFDPQLPLAEYTDQALALCGTRTDVLQLVNVELPLLVAAKKGSVDPVPKVPYNQQLVDARRGELSKARERWVDALDEHQPGLSALMSLVDVEPGWPSLAARRVAGIGPDDYDEPLNMVARRLGEHVLERVCEVVPNVLLEWLIGRRAELDIAGIHSLLDGELGQPLPLRLAVAVLGNQVHDKALEQLTSETDDGEVTEAVELIFSSAVLKSVDVSSWWRLDDKFAAIPAATPNPPRIVSDLRARMLETLAVLLGINESDPDAGRSYFSFIIGSDFVPDDTGPDWELFSTLIPAMRERIEEETGFAAPGCLVREDPQWRDTLRLLINDCQLEAFRLPANGFLHLSDNPDTGLTDPLSNQPVTHEQKASGPHSWTPIQFLMRHVERFMRDHIAELVAPFHVWEYARRLGDDIAARVGSDPRVFLEWLAQLRLMAADGHLHDPDAVARILATQTLGTAAQADPDGVKRPTPEAPTLEGPG